MLPALLMTLMSNSYDSSETLKSVGAKHHLMMGTAVDPRFLEEPEYAQIVGSEFSVLEPENAMKFGPLHPRPDSDPNPFDFADADKLVAFAKAHKMKVRGHTLVWHAQTSRWVGQANFTPDKLAETLHNHINTVVKHFKGKVYAWDVVNEAFNDNGTMRSSLWFDKPGIGFAGKGPEFIEQSLRWAHEADRRVKLFYNDYSAETENKKSDAIYAMAKDFKARGVPLTGIGFQMHLDQSFNSEAVDSVRRNFDRFAKLGLEIHVTEMDVRVRDNSEASLTFQANLYRDIAAICSQQKACKLLQVWGLTDKHSWIPGVFRGTGWALPWDEKYQKKPAYDAIIEGLKTK